MNHPVTTPAGRKKKKIAIITHEYHPVLSGGTIYAEKIARELSSLGNEVEIITTAIGNYPTGLETGEHFKVRRVFTGRKSQKDANFLELLSFLFIGFPQILYHVIKGRFSLLFPFFALPSGLVSIAISFITRVPTILFVDAADTPGFASAQNKMVNRLAFLFRFVTGVSTGIALVDGIQDVAIPQIKNKNIVIIPPATIIPSEQARPGQNEAITQFLSIGRLVPRKGFDLIISALPIVCSQRDDFHLTIIGYGSMEKEIQALIASTQMEEKVSLVGRVEYDRLARYYLDSDCYIFYGGREGSSVAMMESLSYGLPLLASAHQENIAFVIPEKNGFLVPHPDVDSLAEYIIKILESKKKLPLMGRESRNIAEQYSWPNVAKMYDVFFDKLLRR